MAYNKRWTLVVICAAFVCFSSMSTAQSNAVVTTYNWKVFNSTLLNSNKAWETTDWSEFSAGETTSPVFSFLYPTDWHFNGSSVFETSTGTKIAELSPGIIKLAQGQTCYISADSEGDAKGQAILIRKKFRGRRVIGEFTDDYSGNTWHYIDYCLTDGKFAFLISFIFENPDTSLEDQFAKVISSFQFSLRK